MQALTVLEPYGSSIIFGPKPIENRGWRPPPSLIGKRFAIHVGLSRRLLIPSVLEAVALLWPEVYERDWDATIGHVIGTVVLTGYRPIAEVDNGWAFGPFCWMLEDKVPCVPFRATGRLGLFTVPEPVPLKGDLPPTTLFG